MTTEKHFFSYESDFANNIRSFGRADNFCQLTPNFKIDKDIYVEINRAINLRNKEGQTSFSTAVFRHIQKDENNEIKEEVVGFLEFSLIDFMIDKIDLIEIFQNYSTFAKQAAEKFPHDIIECGSLYIESIYIKEAYKEQILSWLISYKDINHMFYLESVCGLYTKKFRNILRQELSTIYDSNIKSGECQVIDFD